jgi:hypothetical protein
MRRCLIVLIAVLIVPLAPWRSAELAGVGSALADDDDDGFRIPRFRVIRPSIPRFRPPPIPRPPRQARPAPQAPAPVPVAIPDAVPGEVVVGPVSPEALDLIIADGFTLVASSATSLLDGTVARLRPPPGVDLNAARQRVLQIAPAAVVEPNHVYRPVEMPCRDGLCPPFEMVGWVVPPDRCTAAPTLGMIDTTVNTKHEALRGQAIEVVSVLAEGEKESSAVHGTAIAALLVGDEGSRTPGLLPDASLVVMEAFHRDAGGDAADVYKIVRAIDELAARRIGVVNLSFAGPPNEVLARAVAAAEARDMILVAAAGNNGPNAEPLFPAAYDKVIAVTAVDRDGSIYRQAGHGKHIAFAAPGVSLWTAASVSGGRYRSGTSYAVPFVSAAFAAALSGDPDATPASLTKALVESSQDLGEAGRDPVFGWGLIRAKPCKAH